MSAAVAAYKGVSAPCRHQQRPLAASFEKQLACKPSCGPTCAGVLAMHRITGWTRPFKGPAAESKMAVPTNPGLTA